MSSGPRGHWRSVAARGLSTRGSGCWPRHQIGDGGEIDSVIGLQVGAVGIGIGQRDRIGGAVLHLERGDAVGSEVFVAVEK